MSKYSREELRNMAAIVLTRKAERDPRVLALLSLVSVRTGLTQGQVMARIEALAL